VFSLVELASAAVVDKKYEITIILSENTMGKSILS
jgi:hypothetical protein